MRALLQRSKNSYVMVDQKRVGEINQGLVVFLGVAEEDTPEDLEKMAQKIVNLRIFEDQQGKMNRSLLDLQGEILLVSQFTLFANTRKGRRPSFLGAGNAEKARDYFQKMKDILTELGVQVASGVFQAEMEVHILNDGPVTILLDTLD